MKKSSIHLCCSLVFATASLAAVADVVDGVPTVVSGVAETGEDLKLDTTEYKESDLLTPEVTSNDSDDDLLLNEEYLAKVEANSAKTQKTKDIEPLSSSNTQASNSNAQVDSKAQSSSKTAPLEQASDAKANVALGANSTPKPKAQNVPPKLETLDGDEPNSDAQVKTLDEEFGSDADLEIDTEVNVDVSLDAKAEAETETETETEIKADLDRAFDSKEGQELEATSEEQIHSLTDDAKASAKATTETKDATNNKATTGSGADKLGAPLASKKSEAMARSSEPQNLEAAKAQVKTQVATPSKPKAQTLDHEDVAKPEAKTIATEDVALENATEEGAPSNLNKDEAPVQTATKEQETPQIKDALVHEEPHEKEPAQEPKEEMALGEKSNPHDASSKHGLTTEPGADASFGNATDKTKSAVKTQATDKTKVQTATKNDSVQASKNKTEVDDAISQGGAKSNGTTQESKSVSQTQGKDEAAVKTDKAKDGSVVKEGAQTSSSTSADKAQANSSQMDQAQMNKAQRNKAKVKEETSAHGAMASNVELATGADNEERDLYSRSYLANMYLPFFYHTYDLPQQLSPHLTLRKVRLADDGVKLVYEIGVDDSMGPMDLDGEPSDNRMLQLFCRIAMSDGGILHRSEGLLLEFFHGKDAFFSKNLTYATCTGKDAGLVRRSISEQERGRLDDEFVYAYQEHLEKDQGLSREYLATYFVPYALERISEDFAPLEHERTLTLGSGTELVMSFTLKPEDKHQVKKTSFVMNRIQRTCRISTYAKWVLPYIEGIRYDYHLSDGSLVRSISVDAPTCEAMREKSMH